VIAITEADLKEWLIDWDRSLKTKANYHGLIHGVFANAVKREARLSRREPGNRHGAQAVTGQAVAT
jgi:hypothetical protein